MYEWQFVGIIHWYNGQKDIPYLSGSTSTAHVYVDKSRDVVGVKRKVSNRKSKIFDLDEGCELASRVREEIARSEEKWSALQELEDENALTDTQHF